MNNSLLQKLISGSKLSKAQIAINAGMSRTTLDNVLNGADVKVSTIESLARVLDVNPSVFFQPSIIDYESSSLASAPHTTTNVSGHNVCGVNVNGRDIDIKCPTEYEALLNIVNANNEIVSRMQAQLDKAQSQIDELIALLKTKL